MVTATALGKLVRVRCTCGDRYCPAPALHGGRTGELVNVEGTLASVWLDDSKTLPGGEGTFDFPTKSVFLEKEH